MRELEVLVPPKCKSLCCASFSIALKKPSVLNRLREFVYSRHPDPRRVWKGGSEQHLLTPLPGAPGANSKKLDVAVKTNTNVTFGRPIPN